LSVACSSMLHAAWYTFTEHQLIRAQLAISLMTKVFLGITCTVSLDSECNSAFRLPYCMFLCFDNLTIVFFKLQTRWLLNICSHLKWRCLIVFLVQYFHFCLLVWPLVGVLCILWCSQIKLYPYLQLWVR